MNYVSSTSLHHSFSEVLLMSDLATHPQHDKLYLGRQAAARLLDVSTRTIDDAIRTGELEAFRVGRRVLIPRDRLVEFAQRVAACS